MKNRFDFLLEVSEKVRGAVSISQVAEKYLTLRRHGAYKKGICPFHADHTIGSFVITDRKKIWKCFSCGAGGDVIQFLALYLNIKYSESALKIALDFGIINLSEYENATNIKITDKEDKKIFKIYKEKDKHKFINNKADDVTLNKVYTLFIDSLDVQLSEEHRKHLKEERHLSESEIDRYVKERVYFTFPTKSVLNNFFKKLQENGLNKDILRTIPGFFYDYTKKNYSFTNIRGGGLGISIKNEIGQIVAIQIRRNVLDKKEGVKSMRYIWFSSSFADSYDNLDFGSSPGCPLNVIYPDSLIYKKGKPCKCIFITEGHFKAKAIAKVYNSIAISVQGVCSWYNVLNTIKRIRKLYSEYDLSYVYVAYDADMGFNTDVFKQALYMGIAIVGNKNRIDDLEAKKIVKTFSDKDKIFYCIWDDDLGKGIDDLIYGGNPKIDKLPLRVMCSHYKRFMEQLNDIVLNGEYENIIKIPKDIKKELYTQMILRTLPQYKCI